jgi:membrane associated rhomboid family serine protease
MKEMARAPFLHRSFQILGGRLSAPAALLIGATFAASILGAQLPGLAAEGVLVPALVLRGEIWRLFTFVLFERDPLGLIFAALALFWFGNELVRVWGPGRFLATYFAIAGGSGLLTVILSLAFGQLRGAAFAGPWPVVSALIIAWAAYFPSRDIFVYFVLPLRGRNLIYATLAGTLLFALLSGSVLAYTPHFAAELGMVAWLGATPLGPLWARIKYELAYRSWRRRACKLKAVPPKDRDDSSPRWYH